MAGGDELHRGDGVLERRSHHPGDVVFADQRRARPVADRMQIQDRAAPVEFGEDRLEFRIGDRAIKNARVHRQPDHAQFVDSPRNFSECGIDVRHRCGRERAEPIRMCRHQRGVLVVDVACRGSGAGLRRRRRVIAARRRALGRRCLRDPSTAAVRRVPRHRSRRCHVVSRYRICRGRRACRDRRRSSSARARRYACLSTVFVERHADERLVG